MTAKKEMSEDFEGCFRAFSGIQLAESMRNDIVHLIQRLAARYPFSYIRWMKFENLHITLTFFGMVSHRQFQKLVKISQEELKDIHSFSVTFSNLVSLPSEKSPRVLTLSAPIADSLVTLESKIRGIAQTCGIRTENRRYLPHITLARIKDRHPFDRLDRVNCPEFKISVEAVTFFKSDLDSSGAIYTPLEFVDLQNFVPLQK